MPIIAPPAKSRQPEEKSPSRPDGSAGREAWGIIGWLGLAFVLMGLADITLGVYPVAFGNPEWEFGVISGVLNGFAIPTMGMYLLLSSAVARERWVQVRIAAVAMFVVAATLVVLGLLYLMITPIALKAVAANEMVHVGMKKAIVKGGIFLIAYWILYVLAGRRGWKLAKRG